MEESSTSSIEERIKVEHQLKAGASWFYWIAGLSLINSALLLSGSQWGFIIGLGVTQIISGIGFGIAEEIGIAGKIIAFSFSIVVAGVFVLFGVFSNKRYTWAFIVGMVLYALDGLIYVLIQDWLSVGFHVFALFCIYGGFQAHRKLNRIEQNTIIQTLPESSAERPSQETFSRQ